MVAQTGPRLVSVQASWDRFVSLIFLNQNAIFSDNKEFEFT